MNALSREREYEERQEAARYAGLIDFDESHPGELDWNAIHAAIVARWSMTALRRIKERAWTIRGEAPR